MMLVVVMVLGMAMPSVVMIMGVNHDAGLRCRDRNAGRGADSAADDGAVASADGGADSCAGAATDGTAEHGAAIHLMEAVRARRDCDRQKHA